MKTLNILQHVENCELLDPYYSGPTWCSNNGAGRKNIDHALVGGPGVLYITELYSGAQSSGEATKFLVPENTAQDP